VGVVDIGMKRLLVLAALVIAVVMLAAGCHAQPVSPSRVLLDQANELRVAEDYAAAIEAYQNICDQYPGSWETSHAKDMIAVSYRFWSRDLIRENSYGPAIEKLEIAVGQYPDTNVAQDITEEGEIPLAYIKWAQYLVREKHDYQSAVEKYELVVAQYPQTKYNYASDAREKIPWCFQRWGDYLFDEGNYADAMDKYDLVLNEYPDSETASRLQQSDDILDCYYSLAQQEEEEGELDSAIENYEAVLEHWPQSWMAESVRRKLAKVYLTRASEFEQEKQWGRAFQIYQKFMSKFSDEVAVGAQMHDVKFELLPQCAYEYGNMLESEKRYPEAIETYQIARLKESREAIPRCHYLWAQQLQAEEKYDEAVEKYVTILSDYPDTVWASWEKGEILAGIPAKCLCDNAAKLGVSESALRLYEAILDYHSESDYITETKQSMVDIGIAMILGGEHGTLPSATSEGTIAAGGTAVIEVRNGTPYTLLVLFKGHDTEVVYLRPHPDAIEYIILPVGGITKYTKEEIRLSPGEYQIGARVSKTDISPWYGTDSFASNERYSQVFYIRVTLG